MELASIPNWLFGGGALGGFVALFYVLLNFARGSRSDAVGAWEKLAVRLQEDNDSLRGDNERLRKRVRELEHKVRNLEAKLEAVISKLGE